MLDHSEYWSSGNLSLLVVHVSPINIWIKGKNLIDGLIKGKAGKKNT